MRPILALLSIPLVCMIVVVVLVGLMVILFIRFLRSASNISSSRASSTGSTEEFHQSIKDSAPVHNQVSVKIPNQPCPVCGAPNPVDAEVCASCRSKLK